VRWQFTGYTEDRLYLLLARLSIMALSLSGSPAARDHLLALRGGLDPSRRAATALAEQVDEALARLNGAGNDLANKGRGPRGP
jgi:hypothetical protein